MAIAEIHAPHERPLARPVELTCIALAIANAVYLLASYVQGSWLVDPGGAAIESDFVNVWAAGHLVLQGNPALAYDWPAHKAVEELAVGHSFTGYFGWHYPPMFLFFAATLALFSYVGAYLAWVLVTFPAYVIVVRQIIGERGGVLLALAFPAILSNFIVGQNGFLSAALIGGALLTIERRPILAGIFVGLLTYKPHLGLLFPIALIAGAHWRVIASATVTTLLIALASWLAFGTETWVAFFQSIPHTSQAFLSDGWANFGKLQTLFGLMRVLGAPESIAWSLQVTLALAGAMTVAIIWRSNTSFEIKAAALATGALLATPYLYTYDLVVLAVPLAFLYRLGRREGFLSHEPGGIALACVLIASFPFVSMPVGFFAVCTVAALVVRRAFLNPAVKSAAAS
ncbi:MAG TPA: glycosyltransferase family 87 protein [Pseudolabrys sp.]|nr:glycosyltransferase family 87 protein [Pseudolabrys sp.]